jgi:hypothetical protein
MISLIIFKEFPMQVVDPGHEYILHALDGGEPQRLLFVKREGHNYPGNVGVHPGLLTQEVVRVLLDRCKYMNAQGSCAETDIIISSLETVLMMFEVRAARCRGTSIDLPHSADLADDPTCPTCGHIQCDQSRHSRPHWSEGKSQ